MLLRSRKYITNNIRRYTHTNNSPSSIKDPNLNYTVLESKLDKIMSKLDEIDFFIKCTYFVLVVPPIISFFK
jgi:hypothetical protein